MIEVLESALRPCDRLVVAFTGVSHALGAIPFEFHKSMGALDCAALFVRDLGRRWYQYDEATIADLTGRIRQAVARSGASRVTFLGNSMGGFGALYFGARLNADAILAFAPQTAIDPVVTEAFGDDRWREHQATIAAYPFGDLAREAPAKGRVAVYYGASADLDAAHVNRLAAHWPMEQVAIPDCGHDVAGRLKAQNELIPLIARTI